MQFNLPPVDHKYDEFFRMLRELTEDIQRERGCSLYEAGQIAQAMAAAWIKEQEEKKEDTL